MIQMAEAGWGAFLVDEDAVGLTELVGGRRPSFTHDPGIVEQAWRARRTIVSSHGTDFVRAIDEFQRCESRRECRDLTSAARVHGQKT